MSQGDHDAVILGAGVGGLLTAARLARAGWTPLVLEASDRLGGRFSTIEKDGYKIPTGAIVVAEDGPFDRSLKELGIDAELRFPEPALKVLIKGRYLDAGKAAWEFMINRVTKTAAKVASGIRNADEDDAGDISIAEWTASHTKNRTVHTLIETVARNVFTANADEVPAAMFFKNVRDGAAYNRFGVAPNGNVVIAEQIADDVRAHGGEVRTGWSVEGLELEGDRVSAVVAKAPDGATETIAAEAVVSNIGPVATARMLAGTDFESAFAERTANVEPTSMLALSISTTEDMMPGIPGMLNFTDTDRLCSIMNLTSLCPGLAPDGRSLYDVYSVPRPSVGGNFDVDEERARLEHDIHEKLPWTADAEVVHFKAMRGETPALRCGPIPNPPVQTPIANLIDVGDGVRPGALIGTSASAQTAMAAAEILGAPAGVAA